MGTRKRPATQRSRRPLELLPREALCHARESGACGRPVTQPLSSHVPAWPPADECESARSRPGPSRKPGGRHRPVRREWAPTRAAPDSQITEALKTKCVSPFSQSHLMGGKFCPEQTRGRQASVCATSVAVPTSHAEEAACGTAWRFLAGISHTHAVLRFINFTYRVKLIHTRGGTFVLKRAWSHAGGGLRTRLVLGWNPPRLGKQIPGTSVTMSDSGSPPANPDGEGPATSGGGRAPPLGCGRGRRSHRRSRAGQCRGDGSQPRALLSPTQCPSAQASASPMSPGHGNRGQAVSLTGDVYQISLAPDSE